MHIKILITGGSGRLASKIKEVSNSSFLKTNERPDLSIYVPSHEALDILNLKNIQDEINRYEPNVVIHAAAMTNPMQHHELFTDLSIQTNIVGTANVVTACLRSPNIPKLVYISTDYVYKTTSYMADETSETIPCNNYGWSKLGGEISVRMMPPEKYLILRAAFTPLPWKHKKAYTDAYKTLMIIDEAAEGILALIRLDAVGIYNLGGAKKQSLYQFAVETLGEKDIDPISRLTAPYNVPINTAMSTNKIKSFTDLNL